MFLYTQCRRLNKCQACLDNIKTRGLKSNVKKNTQGLKVSLPLSAHMLVPTKPNLMGECAHLGKNSDPFMCTNVWEAEETDKADGAFVNKMKLVHKYESLTHTLLTARYFRAGLTVKPAVLFASYYLLTVKYMKSQIKFHSVFHQHHLTITFPTPGAPESKSACVLPHSHLWLAVEQLQLCDAAGGFRMVLPDFTYQLWTQADSI